MKTTYFIPQMLFLDCFIKVVGLRICSYVLFLFPATVDRACSRLHQSLRVQPNHHDTQLFEWFAAGQLQVIGEAIEAYPNELRINWVRAWPGQTVLCVSQVYWTKHIHKAIKTGQKVISSIYIYFYIYMSYTVYPEYGLKSWLLTISPDCCCNQLLDGNISQNKYFF